MSERSTLIACGDLTIYNAAEQKDILLTLVQENSIASLDLSNVREIDGAGLQLLILSKIEAERLGHKIEFINHSDVVIDTIELCNLSILFDDPVILSDSIRA